TIEGNDGFFVSFEARHHGAVSSQSLSERRSFIALLKNSHTVAHEGSRFGISPLGQQSSGDSFVDLGHSTLVSDFDKEGTRAIEVCVCYKKSANTAKERAKIVLDATLEPCMTRQFKVIARGCVFHQRLIDIIFSMLGQP